MARRDGRPLFSLHIEALWRYARDEVRPMFRNSGARVYSEGMQLPEKWIQQRREITARISRAAFEEYWAKFCEEKAGKGEAVSIPGPYDEA